MRFGHGRIGPAAGRRGAVTLAIAVLLAAPALAVLPDEQLRDPALEARARAISRELRCVVCQNQSIDDSDAALARDLRIIVREQLVAGKSDPEVKRHIVDRYGSYVLLKPPFAPETWALWLGPLGVLLAGGWGVWRFVAARRAMVAAPLSAEERARLDTMMGDGK